MQSRQSVRSGLFIALTLTALLVSHASHAAGDPKRGADTFAQECAECHSVKEGKNKKGPSLFAVVGRKAGSMSDFLYSEPMKQSVISWSPDKLDAYIAHPKQLVPGGKMKYDGLAEEKDRADLIAYLNTLR
ncbi:MAG TPA: c-type cytochrome [Thiobacillus sp.]|nr:c-type cytochrome [Thiobacillus sp.]